MSIGVAVPCYVGHIPRLFDFLDSVENQTLKPDKVFVSCSSTKEFPFNELKKYSFPLEIKITEEKKNAAENRNIAIENLLDIDYVTFMDADDIMHPKRIEIIMQVFNKNGCDIILHNYEMSEFNDFETIDSESICIRINELRQHFSGCIEHCDFYKYQHEGIHHSQASVKKAILDAVKYPEGCEFARREDCIFCHTVFNLPNIQSVYISNKLSLYKPSGTLMN
jgi:glycosyltransferase involved in cell wall biosynthesis